LAVGSSLIGMTHSAISAMVEIRSAVRAELETCTPGDVVIVACSGGADSLALSYAVAKEAEKFALRVVGVSVDHGLQSNSATQAATVLRQFEVIGIAAREIMLVTVEVTDGMEASARRARYVALDAASQKYGAVKVFLGHTRDDQAETVLLGLARGSGTRSLSGMAPVMGRYVRPLLGITRQQSLAACIEVGLKPWDDPHNLDRQYLRVRLRLEAIPALEAAIGPGVSAALARSAALLRDDADALDEWASREFRDLDPESMDVAFLSELPRAVRTRLIRAGMYACGAPQGSITADHVNAVESLVTSWHGQGEVSLPGGVKARRISGRLSLLPPAN
jgi:tRNA(Ile)-lysidine synthase